MKKIIAALLAVAALLSGCDNEADVASHNLSQDADQFKIMRRLVFYNGITGEYMLTITGRCSLGNTDKAREVSVTCKTDSGEYVKHFLGLSDNVTYFVEQLQPSATQTEHYQVTFKPSTILPSIQLH